MDDALSWCSRGLIGVSMLLLAACGEMEVLQIVPSPSGKYIARFYRVYGGGAAGYQFFRVDVRSRDEVFQYDDSYVFHMRHGYDVELKWTDDTHLIVGFPSEAEIDKQETMKEVSIEYQPRSDLNLVSVFMAQGLERVVGFRSVVLRAFS